MPVIVKRDDWCYGYNCNSGAWNWARWLLFALFIIGILLVVLSAIRVNRRRSKQGRQPILGTAWITPPSYRQSQTQNPQNPPYVPQYTEQTNDNDLGYYNAQGDFVPNPKMREAFGEVHLNTLVPDSTGAQSYQRTGENEHDDFNRDFARYYNGASSAPGASSSAVPEYGVVSGANTNSNNVDNDFQRPTGPPPAHTRN